MLNVLPLFHAHGLISGLLTALAAGSSVVCPPGFDAAAFFGWLTEFRPTWYTAVPPIHRALISAAGRHKRDVRPSSLRLIRSASASLPTDVLDELEALFGVPVIETYGMTEAASQIAANPLERRKPGSVGKPAGAEIAIMDGEGRQLPAGERGEIVLRGPTITRGYDNNAAANEIRFSGRLVPNRRPRLPGRRGISVHLLGRIKKADVINRGGQKVSPAEVEKALLSHPDVVEAVAFPIPHKRLGEDVAVAVVLRPEAKISAQQLRRFASEHLGAVQGARPDPHCAGDPGGPRRKDHSRRTRHGAFDNDAEVARRTQSAVGGAPLGIGVAAGRKSGRTSWSSMRSGSTKTSSRSARIPSRWRRCFRVCGRALASISRSGIFLMRRPLRLSRPASSHRRGKRIAPPWLARYPDG